MICVIAAAATAVRPVAAGDIVKTLAALNARLPKFSLSHPPDYPEEVRAYFAYYKLNPSGATHFFGSFPSGGYALAAHVFQRPRAAGTVFLMHGYFDHAGTVRRAVHHLIDRGYSAAVFDLPGHGLSSGKRGAVEDFSVYTEALRDFIALCRPHLKTPFFAAGHSTGAAIISDYLLEARGRDFDRIVLIAPLVRSAWWTLSRIGGRLGGPFLETLPRRIRQTSSDPASIEFLKQDPLQSRRFPMTWLTALFAWEARIRDAAPAATPALLIQGDRDAVVDWKYNVPFLKKKLPNLTVKWIKGGRHQLLNEADPLRRRVLKETGDFLAGGPE